MPAGTLWREDATAQAALVRAGKVGPRELVDLALERIHALNPSINAVVTVLADEAYRRAADPTIRARPFGGVPLLLKDAGQELAGTPYTLATPLLHNLGYRSPRTTELTRRLLDAGFIIVGKTNLPELSSGMTTEPRLFGPCRNPWDLTRTVGGSSGGSAAAVAAGLTAVAHGCDATGSLRIPASVCGIATLKPSRGAVPSEAPAAQPDPLGVWSDFVLARSVRDLAAIFRLVRQPAPPAQPQSAPAGLRVGLLTHDPLLGMDVDPACVATVEQTGAALRDQGHQVTHAYPAAFDSLFNANRQDTSVITAHARAGQVDWLARTAGRTLTPDDLSPHLLAQAEQGRRVTAQQVETAVAHIHNAVKEMLDWWRSGFDLLVTPMSRRPAWPLGLPDGPAHAGVFSVPASFSGQPALSLPLHTTAEGLPVGVQIIGNVGQDQRLLAVAAQLEEALPWADRWPLIAAQA